MKPNSTFTDGPCLANLQRTKIRRAGTRCTSIAILVVLGNVIALAFGGFQNVRASEPERNISLIGIEELTCGDLFNWNVRRGAPKETWLDMLTAVWLEGFDVGLNQEVSTPQSGETLDSSNQQIRTACRKTISNKLYDLYQAEKPVRGSFLIRRIFRNTIHGWGDQYPSLSQIESLTCQNIGLNNINSRNVKESPWRLFVWFDGYISGKKHQKRDLLSLFSVIYPSNHYSDKELGIIFLPCIAPPNIKTYDPSKRIYDLVFAYSYSNNTLKTGN